MYKELQSYLLQQYNQLLPDDYDVGDPVDVMIEGWNYAGTVAQTRRTVDGSREFVVKFVGKNVWNEVGQPVDRPVDQNA